MAAEEKEDCPPFELFCWSGIGNLPSIDPSCLQVMVYAKFASCSIKTQFCDNPWKSPTGILPVITTKDETETCPSKILEFLRKRNFNADYQLTPKQGAETMAFSALVRDKLHPAFLHMLWVDDSNYSGFTRPWYAKKLPFPLNYFVPGQMQRSNIELLNVIKGDKSADEAALSKKVYKEACECLNILSQRLGKSEFFFGERPSTLDAIVFSYVAVIEKLVDLPNNKLRNHLQGCQNLVQFCARIKQRYFPEVKEDSTGEETQQINEDPITRRNDLLSVAVGVTALLGYAYYMGLSFRKAKPNPEEERYAAFQQLFEE